MQEVRGSSPLISTKIVVNCKRLATRSCQPFFFALVICVTGASLFKPNGTLRSHRFREKASVVDADFVGHEVVEQTIQVQDDVLVLFGLNCQIVHLRQNSHPRPGGASDRVVQTGWWFVLG
jgi:hypothetical protein